MQDKEKNRHLAILDKIREMLDNSDMERLSSKKKPAVAAIEVDASPIAPPSKGDDLDARFQAKQDEKDGESPADDGDGQDDESDPNDEEDDLKQKLIEMYSNLKK